MEEAAPDVMGYDEARETVKENIEYGILSERYPVERLDEIVDIASEVLCSKRSSFSLGKDTYPYELVKDRLLRLDGSHIEYMLIALFSTKFGQTWRLADGITVSEKFLHIADGFTEAMQSP